MSAKVIKSELTYIGKIINVFNDSIILDNGACIERELVKHSGASAILPVDKDGNIILVRQYRHSVGSEVLEIPAGTLEKNEDPLVCAVRELEEETGYKSDNIVFLFKYYSAIGFCNEVLHIYLARDLYEGNMNLDDDEFIQIEKFSLDDVIKMIFNGAIVDGKTIAAVLAYKGNLY